LLYGYGADRELAIASTTKLMTALLTLERVPQLQTVFTQNNYTPAPTDSQIGLAPGDRMTVRDLLLAMLLPSADDAAEDLAYNVGHGSVATFVAAMNQRAAQLGLRHTHYSTPIGFDTPGNYSSATDLAALTRYLFRHQPFFASAVALPAAELSSGPVRHITNRNDLVGRIPWITGVKTGHTLQAGYVLVGSGTQRGMTLIAPVLGTASQAARDQNTLTLLEWGFANFHVLRPVLAGTVMARPTVQDRSGVHATVIAASSFQHVFARSATVRTVVDVPRQLAGPLPRHAVVGQVLVQADGRTVASVPLLLAKALPAVSPLTKVAAFLTRPFTLIVLVLLLGMVGGTAMFWRQRTRALAAGTRR
jgi:D-alanyl-D-alanine carboxypeptidase (penicillin-binding protein 5/6)